MTLSPDGRPTTSSINSFVEVIISVDGRNYARVSCDIMREDLQQLGTFGTGEHGFLYRFSPPLALEKPFQISVRFSQTGTLLPNGESAIPALDETRRLTPILVTALGRSGTTLLMNRLLESVFIVGGELYPFELRMLSYYATVYNVLTAPGDHQHSTHPDALEGTGTLVGSNPFFHDSYRTTFLTVDAFDQFFKNFVPSHLASLLRKLTNEFYLTLCEDQRKYDALYFAEKSNSLHSWPRDFARYAFGSVKELILLRDPRDLYCSHRHYFKSDQQTALDQVRSACEALISLYNRDATDIFFIHYEKMLCKERSTYDALSSFLGVPISSEDRTGREMHLFTEHSTSLSPSASVGRWKFELSAAEVATVELNCADFLSIFNYRDLH